MALGEHGSPGDGLPLAEQYRALHEGLAWLEIARDAVRVAGPDAEKYLQGQLSQDVARLSPGQAAWSLVLAPQGKLDAFVRCSRVADDEFVLDTDPAVGERLVERLLRFRLRTKAEAERLAWRALAVRGPGAAQPPFGGPDGGGGPLVAPFEWGGLVGYDLLGPHPAPPPGALAIGEEAYEAARVEAGFPRHGAELDERTIPAEAGLVEATVNFTKGCYTGQELVARIDSRGNNVPRRLRGLFLAGPAHPGDVLHPAGGQAGEKQAAEKEVGRVTSVAFSPGHGWVALAYVGRAAQAAETVVVGEGGTARVQALPFPAAG
ncbi:MAG: YgfZ/GcvT domain-containing protein [Acidimicrobiales bacterium]